MDHRLVETLEREIEEAIASVLQRARGLPLDPSPRTVHLMAKGAVAVYEAAVETAETRRTGH